MRNAVVAVARLFAGLFLCNAIPHLCSGLMGQPFPTPFADPPGVGDSSAVTNAIWGIFNLTVAGLLVSFGGFRLGLNVQTLFVWIGFSVASIFLSRTFEARHHRGEDAARPVTIHEIPRAPMMRIDV